MALVHQGNLKKICITTGAGKSHAGLVLNFKSLALCYDLCITTDVV